MYAQFWITVGKYNGENGRPANGITPPAVWNIPAWPPRASLRE